MAQIKALIAELLQSKSVGVQMNLRKCALAVSSAFLILFRTSSVFVAAYSVIIINGRGTEMQLLSFYLTITNNMLKKRVDMAVQIKSLKRAKGKLRKL